MTNEDTTPHDTSAPSGLLSPGSAAVTPPEGEPLWMLRVNPLRRARLADPALRAELDALGQAEDEVRDLAARCSDALYELIGAATDRDARGQLIALRRAIHNDATPRPTLLVDHPDVARWQDARARRSDVRDRITALHPDALATERGTLAGLLCDGDLRRSMALVAPDAAEGSERYVEAVTGSRPLTARLRKSERGLVQYVTRAMVRTSPMARFTAVGFAVPEVDGPPLDAPEFGRPVPRLGLDRVMLDYVLGGLHTSGRQPGPDTLVQLPPTSNLSEDGGQLYFLRPDGQGGVRRLAAKVAPVVRLLLDATTMGPRRIADVMAYVADRAGCSQEQALRAILGAVQQGLLCTRALPEAGDADVAHLLAAPGTTSPEGVALQARVRTELTELAESPPGEWPASLRRLKGSLSELSRTAERPAQLVVEDDTVLESVRVSTADWRDQLEDLAAGVALMSTFDLMHDVRALVVAAFVDRFGAGAEVSLVDHAEYLVNEMYRRGLSIEDPTTAGGLGPADGSLDRLYELREKVADALGADLTRAAEDGGDVVWTSSQAMEAVALMPDRFRRDPLLYGVLVQPWQGRLLFNNAYAGHGMLNGRFLAADRELGGQALPHLSDRLGAWFGADGSRLVEDLGLHRLNVNAHPQVLDEGLRPDDWYTLRLVHDPDTDTLGIRDAEGRPLRILTLGTGHPEMYPYPLRLANWLTAGGELRESLVGNWHTTRERDGRTQACPRFSVGSAMLSRRRWYGGEELERALATGPAEHDRLLALTRWRHLHGVPEEVLLKSTADGYPPSANAGEGGGQDETRRDKPQYVDLASALSVRVLPQMMQRRGEGYLEEALPRVSDGPHAMEWITEIGSAPGGSFQYGGKTR